MTTEDFTTAARAEAERQAPLDGHPAPALVQEREGLVAMAVWAQDHLTAQEVSDAEVEAARIAIHQALAPDWMAVANVLGADQAEYDSLLDSLTRAALTAARAVRRDAR